MIFLYLRMGLRIRKTASFGRNTAVHGESTQVQSKRAILKMLGKQPAQVPNLLESCDICYSSRATSILIVILNICKLWPWRLKVVRLWHLHIFCGAQTKLYYAEYSWVLNVVLKQLEDRGRKCSFEVIYSSLWIVETF